MDTHEQLLVSLGEDGNFYVWNISSKDASILSHSRLKQSTAPAQALVEAPVVSFQVESNLKIPAATTGAQNNVLMAIQKNVVVLAFKNKAFITDMDFVIQTTM